jgi:NTE family protein
VTVAEPAPAGQVAPAAANARMGVTQLKRRRAPKPTVVLGITAVCIAMAFIDATIVNIAFPNLERSFHSSSTSSVSWVLNAYNIVFASFLVAAGKIGDVFGRRRMLLAGVLVFTIGSALCAIAGSIGMLVAFRVLQALGGAMLVPCSLALVLDAFPPERRAHAVAMFSAISALAAGLGPSLGGLLIAASSWRLVFLVNVPVGVIAFALVRAGIVESRAPGHKRLPDIPGALVFAAATAALVLAIVQGQDWGWGSVRVIVAFAVALVLGAMFVVRSQRHPMPILDLSLFRVRAVAAANAITIIASIGFYGYTLVNVLFLTEVWRYSILDAGLAITPGPFIAMAVAASSSRLTERVGTRALVIPGGLIWAAGVYWFVQRAGLHPDYLSRWLPGMVLAGIGAGIVFPNISSVAVASAPESSFATATSLNGVLRQVGAALGVALVVAIIGNPTPLTALHAFHDAWTFGACALVVAGLGSFAIGRVSGVLPAVIVTDDEREQARNQQLAEAEDAGAPLVRAASSATQPSEPEGPPESTADFLAQVSIFSALSEEMLSWLAGASTERSLEPGEWLFHEGDAGDAMFVIRAGRLDIIGDRGQGQTLRQLARGAVVGELALLTSEPRSASVRAARATDLIAIERADLDAIMERHPEVARAMLGRLALDLRAARPSGFAPRTRPVSVALVALDAGVPLDELSAKLDAALSHHANVAVLRRPDLTNQPSEDSGLSVYGPMLDRAAAAHDVVLTTTADPWSSDSWTRFCVQQADRVLAIASTPAPLRAEEIAPSLHGCDLVGWNIPAGTGQLAEWAELLQPYETHAWHSDSGLEQDLSRSARRLTGRSVGIVLGGGGARAFAHLGVLEELTAAGITIDRVGGVSMGSYIGALFASGLTIDEIDAHCYENWVRRNPLGDYTIPRHSLIRGRRAEAMGRRTFGSTRIEELQLSFFALAADLRAGEPFVYRHGSLVEAIGASMSLPGLAPPRIQGQRMMVDGALVDNLPVSVMAESGSGPIIASDVRMGSPRPAGAASARARLPLMGETLMRVMFFGARRGSAADAHVSLAVTPRSEGISLLEFHQIDRAREAGRVAAREALQQLPPELL